MLVYIKTWSESLSGGSQGRKGVVKFCEKENILEIDADKDVHELSFANLHTCQPVQNGKERN